MKTTCHESPKKNFVIPVSEQVLAEKLFKNRFLSHRHGDARTILFRRGWRQKREVRCSPNSHSLICLHMQSACSLSSQFIRTRAGLLTTKTRLYADSPVALAYGKVINCLKVSLKLKRTPCLFLLK